MKNNWLYTIYTLSFFFLLYSCSTKKNLINDNSVIKNIEVDNENKTSLAFVQKVTDNEIYHKNISSKIDFTYSNGKANFSISGNIMIKKDEIIRIQLTPLGLIEAARIELTPNGVLLMDRIHKTYALETYKNIDFLNNTELDFYTLQSILLSQLFIPGKDKLTENDKKQFQVKELNANTNYIFLNKNALKFVWEAESIKGKLNMLIAEYINKASESYKLMWKYDNFVALGSKYLPQKHSIETIVKKDDKITDYMSIQLYFNKYSTEIKDITPTEISQKYKKITILELIDNAKNF